MKNRTQTITGAIKMPLSLCSPEKTARTPELMLRQIALALNMSPLCFRMRKRRRDLAELRFIGAYFLRMHFPEIRLYEIAALFGGQDHSSIINGICRTNELIYTGNTQFIEKYKTASRSIELWMQKETTTYALAASA